MPGSKAALPAKVMPERLKSLGLWRDAGFGFRGAVGCWQVSAQIGGFDKRVQRFDAFVERVGFFRCFDAHEDIDGRIGKIFQRLPERDFFELLRRKRPVVGVLQKKLSLRDADVSVEGIEAVEVCRGVGIGVEGALLEDLDGFGRVSGFDGGAGEIEGSAFVDLAKVSGKEALGDLFEGVVGQKGFAVETVGDGLRFFPGGLRQGFCDFSAESSGKEAKVFGDVSGQGFGEEAGFVGGSVDAGGVARGAHERVGGDRAGDDGGDGGSQA